MLSTYFSEKTHAGMGTVMSHKVFGMYAEDSLDAVCRELSRLEMLLSRFIPESDVSRINQSAGKAPVKISPETFDVLTRAVEMSSFCHGSFDITIAPLVALWNIGKESFHQPTEKEIKHTLSLVNTQDLILDPDNRTALLRKTGESIDLGGIGKGYSGDRILELYRAFGIQSAYSNLGGNVVTLGAKPDGTPWQIGIQHPRRRERLLGTVSVVDQSVVTSGDYQRRSNGSNGKYFHHILNPSTGYPVDSGLISVTIVAENSMTADALSTAIFAIGLDMTINMLKSFPKTEAILVDAGEQVFVTPELKDQFHPAEGIRFTLLA